MSITALPAQVNDHGSVMLAFTVVLPHDAPVGTANRVLEEVRQLLSQYHDPAPRRAVLEPNGLVVASPGVPSLVICSGSREVRLDGRPLAMTRREYDLLQFLARHPRQVFTRAQLLRQVWGYDLVGGERTVDVHIRRLRLKLDAAARCIVTVRGVGYRLDGEGFARIDVWDS